MVAGEFSRYEGKYIKEYAGIVAGDHLYWSKDPTVWGIHDYNDLIYYWQKHRNDNAEQFIAKLGRRYHSPPSGSARPASR
jgi:hypothetical protein